MTSAVFIGNNPNEARAIELALNYHGVGFKTLDCENISDESLMHHDFVIIGALAGQEAETAKKLLELSTVFITVASTNNAPQQLREMADEIFGPDAFHGIEVMLLHGKRRISQQG